MEISLYDTNGKPVMYIADDGETIYNWDGYAVCYLVDEKIYGWRGKHLGWFINDIIYDEDGYRLGYTREASPRIVYTEWTKWTKKTMWTKHSRYTAKHQPILKNSESSYDLASYLGQDKT